MGGTHEVKEDALECSGLLAVGGQRTTGCLPVLLELLVHGRAACSRVCGGAGVAHESKSVLRRRRRLRRCCTGELLPGKAAELSGNRGDGDLGEEKHRGY